MIALGEARQGNASATQEKVPLQNCRQQRTDPAEEIAQGVTKAHGRLHAFSPKNAG